MKNQVMAIMFILGLGSLTWGSAQGTKSDLFDLKKSRQELEVMKGILSTTIGFVSNELRGHEGDTYVFSNRYARSFGMGSNITAYYLYGQGATFVIPISSFRFATTMGKGVFGVAPKIATFYDGDVSRSLFEVQAEMEALNHDMAAHNEEMALAAQEAAEAAQSLALVEAGGVVGGVPGGVSGGVVGGVPGGISGGVGGGVGRGKGSGAGSSQATPTPSAPAPPPAKAQAKEAQDIRKKLEEAQSKVRRAREDTEARRKKLLESVAQMTGYLVEALANHGDSLTFVKPNEYINIVITTDEGMPLLADDGEALSTRQVLSVQKSVITDYKAGRLTLDAFKQKVLQYNN